MKKQMTLFEMVEDERLLMDMDVMDFCGMIGISQTTYYKLSEGNTAKRTIYKIAKHTNLTKEDMFAAPIKHDN